MARGTHGRQGPPPDPNALRRDRKPDQAGWVTLPAEGRAGDPPDWPLSDPSGRELDLWRSEWTRPQAVMWETQGQALEVAVFVRTLVAAESRQATAAERTLVLRQMEALGISIPGLARNKWRIGASDAVAEVKATGTESARPRRAARDRLKLVDGKA